MYKLTWFFFFILFVYVLAGGGLFVDMMKRATQTKQFAELDHAVRTKVEPYLYNKGKGKWIPVEKLVLLRNKDRPRHKMVRRTPLRFSLDIYRLTFSNNFYFFTRLAQLAPLKAMENPTDYDIDKDMGDDEVDETKIGSVYVIKKKIKIKNKNSDHELHTVSSCI